MKSGLIEPQGLALPQDSYRCANPLQGYLDIPLEGQYPKTTLGSPPREWMHRIAFNSPGASLVPPKLSKWSFPASLVPPRLSNWSFPASLVPPRLSNWSFPASLVPPWRLAGCPISPFLPPWCLPGCPIDPFLPPWCFPGCPISCLPGASQAVQLASLVPHRLSNWSFPASLVPPKLSNWSFPVSLVPPTVQLVLSCHLVLSCLPGASPVVQLVLSYLPDRLLESVGLALADYWSHPVVGI